MNRNDIAELHYIAPIRNVPSIMIHGILSHNCAASVAHDSVAMAEIQERRENKQIPGAGMLHDYVNLYFDAHNPMLSKCRANNDNICILRVNPAVLDLPGVVITDLNAASGIACFNSVISGLEAMSLERIFARYWTHQENSNDEKRHKLEKCAEVLVPECVPSQYLLGTYVANQVALDNFQQQNLNLNSIVKNDIFFL